MDLDMYDVYDVYHENYDEDDTRLPKRYVRDGQNPFEYWSVVEFKKRYHFSKETVMHIILPLIENELQKPSQRGLSIAPVEKLLISLRFYATASFQIVCGDLSYVSQATVSVIVATVSRLLAALRPQFVKFPSTAGEKARNRQAFRDLGSRDNRDGIPGVDGAIDCVHVKIVNTPGQLHHEAFWNRKSFFSINVQVIAGPQEEFFDVVARWAGSTHDSRIFSLSRVNMRYRQGELDGKLLGDSAYASLPFLLTPIINPQTDAQQRYNAAHIKARNVVERAFGIWKRRFPCLSRGMGNKLENVTNIIVACAVLHNLARKDADHLDEEPVEEEVEANIDARAGFAVRQAIIERFFT